MLYQSDTLTLEWIDEGIAGLVFNAPGSVNKLDIQTLSNLDEAVNVLERQTRLKGVLLSSGKVAFIAGADITEFFALFDAPKQKLTQWLVFANNIFSRLEDVPVPTVSAVNGYALGGGCECILATDFRLATPDARIGLPETKLGIMPGFGGTVRLPRLLGADSALEIIAAGKDIAANESLRIGLVDAIVTSDNLRHAALKMLKAAINGEFDWRARRVSKLGPLRLNKIEATMSFATAKGLVMKTAGKHYPAPLKAVETVEAAAFLGRKAALELETNSFITLARSSQARAMIGIFLNDQYVKNKAKKLTQNTKLPQQAAVLGAGIMGGGIAWQSAWEGVPVLMKDINPDALNQGINEVAKLLNKQFERGKIDGIQLAKIMARVQPTLSYSEFNRADIVIEAVVENLAIKMKVLAEAEQSLPEDAVIASNTSTIPISQLAKGLKRPSQFCGMHFFNPVSRMPLVEIIRGEKTADTTIAKVVAWASKMGKTPIIVNDCPGFFVNRVLFPYFAAFSLLLRDGADFRQIDDIMEKQFGWPMGPAHLLDVVGIDTAHHAQKVMAQGFPQRMKKNYRDAIEILYEAQRYGQKNQQGFYLWQRDNKGKLQKLGDSAADKLLEKICQPRRVFTDEEVINRMMIPMLNEVVRCLEEEIISSPEEADMALVYGLGFPPFHGGAFRYLDSLGGDIVLSQISRFVELGPLYQPPDALRTKANNRGLWYPRSTAINDHQLKMA